MVDQGPAAFGGQAPAPAVPMQPIAQLRRSFRAAGFAPQVKPAKEFLAFRALCHPEPQERRLVVVGEVSGKALSSNLLPGSGYTVGDEAHHGRVRVKGLQQPGICFGELAQHQPCCLQEDLHSQLWPLNTGCATINRRRTRVNNPSVGAVQISDKAKPPLSL